MSAIVAAMVGGAAAARNQQNNQKPQPEAPKLNIEEIIENELRSRGEISKEERIYWQYDDGFLGFGKELTAKVGERDYQVQIGWKNPFTGKRKLRCSGGNIADNNDQLLEIKLENDSTVFSKDLVFKKDSGLSAIFFESYKPELRKLYEIIPAAKNLITYQFLKNMSYQIFNATAILELYKKLAYNQSLAVSILYTLANFAVMAGVQTAVANFASNKITSNTPAEKAKRIFEKSGRILEEHSTINEWARFEKKLFESDREVYNKYLNRKAEFYAAVERGEDLSKYKIPNLRPIPEDELKDYGQKLFEMYVSEGLIKEERKKELRKFLTDDYLRMLKTGLTVSDKKTSVRESKDELEEMIKSSLRSVSQDEFDAIATKASSVNNKFTYAEASNYLINFGMMAVAPTPLIAASFFLGTGFIEGMENAGQNRSWYVLFLDVYKKRLQGTAINEEVAWQQHDTLFYKRLFLGGAVGAAVGGLLQLASYGVSLFHKTPDDVLQSMKDVPVIFSIVPETIPTIAVGAALAAITYGTAYYYYRRWHSGLQEQFKTVK